MCDRFVERGLAEFAFALSIDIRKAERRVEFCIELREETVQT